MARNPLRRGPSQSLRRGSSSSVILVSVATLALVAMSAAVSGCDDGEDDDESLTPLVRIVELDAGGTCPTGGQRIETGVDLDGDGVLADNEVTSQGVVCQGAAGVDVIDDMNDMASGDTGMVSDTGTVDTSASDTAAVDTAENDTTDNDTTSSDTSAVDTGEPPVDPDPTDPSGTTERVEYTLAMEAECQGVGVREDQGVDADDSGTLEMGEIDQSTLMCFEPNGRSDELVEGDSLSAGDPDCGQGGVVIRSGIDADQSGALEASEVRDEHFFCNG